MRRSVGRVERAGSHWPPHAILFFVGRLTHAHTHTRTHTCIIQWRRWWREVDKRPAKLRGLSKWDFIIIIPPPPHASLGCAQGGFILGAFYRSKRATSRVWVDQFEGGTFPSDSLPPGGLWNARYSMQHWQHSRPAQQQQTASPNSSSAQAQDPQMQPAEAALTRRSCVVVLAVTTFIVGARPKVLWSPRNAHDRPRGPPQTCYANHHRADPRHSFGERSGGDGGGARAPEGRKKKRPTLEAHSMVCVCLVEARMVCVCLVEARIPWKRLQRKRKPETNEAAAESHHQIFEGAHERASS